MELANFHIEYQPRTAIKGQALADFIAKFSLVVDRTGPGPNHSKGEPSCDETATEPWRLLMGNTWQLFVYGASNSRGSGAGIVLVSPNGTIHEHALTLNLRASNNEAEYEALIAGLKMAGGLGIQDLVIYSDSQLVVLQVSGEYETKDDRMTKYVASATELLRGFQNTKGRPNWPR